MTKRFSKTLGLVCISLSAFFYGCQEEDDIAAGLIDGNITNAYKVDTFDITTSVVLDNDSINTLNKSVFYAGSYSDNNFGEISSAAYFTIAYNTSSFEAPDDAVIDSVIFNIAYDANESYGLLNTEHNYEVSILTEQFDREATKIYNNTSLSDNSTNYVTSDATLPVPISDTLLKLTLSTDFGDEIFNFASDSVVDYFPGLKIKGSTDNTSMQGFEAYNINSRIQIYYHTADEDSLDVSLGIYRNFTSTSSDLSATPLNALANSGDIISTEDLGNSTFVHSALGIRTLVTFTSLDQFIDSLDGHSINRAYLIVPVDTVSSSSITPALNLYHTENGINNGSYLDSYNAATWYSDFEDYVAYDPDSAVYRIPLTFYLNELKTDQLLSEQYSITPLNYDDYNGSQLQNIETDMTSAIGYDNAVTNGDRQMKLVIYYSETTIE